MLTPQGPHIQDVHSRETLLTSSSLQLLQLQVHMAFTLGCCQPVPGYTEGLGSGLPCPSQAPHTGTCVLGGHTGPGNRISSSSSPGLLPALLPQESEWSEGSIFSCSFPLYPEDISLIYLLHASSQFGICFPEDA